MLEMEEGCRPALQGDVWPGYDDDLAGASRQRRKGVRRRGLELNVQRRRLTAAAFDRGARGVLLSRTHGWPRHFLTPRRNGPQV